MTTVTDFVIRGVAVDRAVVERLGWTLILFLWQGAAIAAVLALLDALLSRHRAVLRYTCACVALVGMLAAPLLTFAVLTASSHTSSQHPVILSSPSVRTPTAMGASDFRPLRTISKAAGNRIPVRNATVFRPRLSRIVLPWFVAFWGLGVFVLSLRLLGGWWLVRRLARPAQHVALEGWQTTIERLSRRLEVARPVRLMRSVLVTVPTTIGWLRPMILLPASTLTGLLPTQIEAILAHELAHIRRHDYLVNLLQSLLETLLFYHPAVWWVSRRIRDEREFCCDELAVEASGDPIVYARALVELERLRGEEIGLAMAATSGSLAYRIARLLGVSRRSRQVVPRGLAWAVVAAVILIGSAAGGAVRVKGHPLEAPLAAAQAVCQVATAAARIAPSVAATSAAKMVHGATAIARAAASMVDASAPEVACDTPPSEEPSKDSMESSRADEALPEEAPVAAESDVKSASQLYSEEDWQRLAQNGVSPRYVANLARNGYSNLTVDELTALAQHGVMSAYAGKMRRILGNPSVTELVQLADHGVSSEYAGKIQRALGDVSAADLIALADHGVSSAYTIAMRKNGDLRVVDLIQLADHGVASDYLTGLRELGLQDLSTDDLIRLANSGVTLDWFAAMRWMGYPDISVESAIELQNEGVTPDFAASLRVLHKRRLSFDELRTLRNQGVDVEYAASLMGILRKDLNVDQLVRLHNQGISVEYVAGMNAIGRSDLSADDLITLNQQGIDPEYVTSLASAGYRDLDVRDLVRMRQSGVDADFIESVRDAGFGTPDMNDLIRMRQNGIPEERRRP